LCFLAQVVYMREEYNSVLSTPTEANKIGRFGRYIGKTQISATADIYLYLQRKSSTSLTNKPMISICLQSQHCYITVVKLPFITTQTLYVGKI